MGGKIHGESVAWKAKPPRFIGPNLARGEERGSNSPSET